MNVRTKRVLVICVRVWLGGLAAVFLLFGGECLREAWGMRREIKEMERPLVEMAVDLSRAGTYSATMPPVEAYFHGIGVWVEIETAERNEDELQKFIEGVGGTLRVVDADGELVCEWAFSDDRIVCRAGRPELKHAYATFLDRVPEYAAEHSMLTLKIDQPAEGLAGVRQMLIAKYNLCGLESLPLLIVGGAGVFLMLMGLVAAIVAVVPVIRRKKKTVLNDVAQNPAG